MEYSPIEGDILFTFAPDSIDGFSMSGDPALYLKTEKIYGYLNYEIGYNKDQQTNEIVFDLKGI